MRKFIDIFEDINAIPTDIVAQILSHPRCKHGVKIGANAKLWRGESEDSGSGMAVYGLGTYFTCDKSYAARFGKVSEVSRTLLPDNCLRFDTTNDFQIWLQDAIKLLGYNDKLAFAKDYYDFADFIHDLDLSIDGIQMFKNKDAMFVLYP